MLSQGRESLITRKYNWGHALSSIEWLKRENKNAESNQEEFEFTISIHAPNMSQLPVFNLFIYLLSIEWLNEYHNNYEFSQNLQNQTYKQMKIIFDVDY